VLIPFLLVAAIGVSFQDPPTIQQKVAAMRGQIDAKELERTVRDLAGFGTRHVTSATDREDRGTGAARSYLQRRFEELIPASGGRLTVRREAFDVVSTRLRRDVTVVNVVAELRGTTDPERIYVVGGHYDSINGNGADAVGDAPGANDDASGTAVVLEACRAMVGTPFPATILFVAYDGEEQGLLGSDAHAKALAEAGARVDGMITNDIVGNTLGVDGVRRDDYLRCFSFSARGNDSTGRSLARAATYAARTHVPGFEVRMVLRGDRYGRGGDHRSFHVAGYPAIRFTEPAEDWSRQHQNVVERDGKPYGDLPEFVDFAYLAKVTAANVALLGELASAPPPPERVAARGARDAYTTILTLPAPGEGVVYEAVWRATTAADWEAAKTFEALTIRDGVQLSLPGVYLDDVVPGVRAVGADGARSRATTAPEPDALVQSPGRAGRGR
jgi:hypothetical protein